MTFAVYASLGAGHSLLALSFLQQVANYSASRPGCRDAGDAAGRDPRRRASAASRADRAATPMAVGPLVGALGCSGSRASTNVRTTYAVLPAALLFGLGLAITVAPLTTAVLAGRDRRHAGSASEVSSAIARIAGLPRSPRSERFVAQSDEVGERLPADRLGRPPRAYVREARVRPLTCSETAPGVRAEDVRRACRRWKRMTAVGALDGRRRAARAAASAIHPRTNSSRGASGRRCLRAGAGWLIHDRYRHLTVPCGAGRHDPRRPWLRHCNPSRPGGVGGSRRRGTASWRHRPRTDRVLLPRRMERTRSPRTLSLIAPVALWMLTLIVVTGAAVRVTGSGLGCPTWPKCTEQSVYTELNTHGPDRVRQPHADVLRRLRGDRAFAALSSPAVRRDLMLLGLLLPLGVVAQAVLGGFTVLYDLAPGLVMSHFMLSMLILVACVALDWRAHREPPAAGSVRARASDRLVALGTWSLLPSARSRSSPAPPRPPPGHTGGADTDDNSSAWTSRAPTR